MRNNTSSISKDGKLARARLFTVPYFFERSFRYTASNRHGFLDFQNLPRGRASGIIARGGRGGGKVREKWRDCNNITAARVHGARCTSNVGV